MSPLRVRPGPANSKSMMAVGPKAGAVAVLIVPVAAGCNDGGVMRMAPVERSPFTKPSSSGVVLRWRSSRTRVTRTWVPGFEKSFRWLSTVETASSIEDGEVLAGSEKIPACRGRSGRRFLVNAIRNKSRRSGGLPHMQPSRRLGQH